MHGFAQRWVSRVLERLLPEDVAEGLVGDLLEEHALRARTSGAAAAARWYWGQLVRSIAPVLHTAFRRGDWVIPWAAGWIAYSVAVSVEVSARAAVAAVATHTAVDAIPVLILYLGTLALAGCVAERARSGAALALALVVALTAAVQLVTAANGMPWWYRIVVVTAGPAAALAGDALLSRARRAVPSSGRSTTVA